MVSSCPQGGGTGHLAAASRSLNRGGRGFPCPVRPFLGSQEGVDRKTPLRGEKPSEFRIEHVYFEAFRHQRISFRVKLGYSLEEN